MTNEGGYAGTVRLLRNVTGLWVLQSCRRWWQRQGTELSYPELVELAPASRACAASSTPTPRVPRRPPHPRADRRVLRADRHPRAAGRRRDDRVVLDSLALAYRHVAEDLAVVTGRRVPSVNIVGGGSNNTLLSQLTADACGVPVFCGPVEATALGNAATQLAALGELGDLHDIRRVVAATEPVTPYAPPRRRGLGRRLRALHPPRRPRPRAAGPRRRRRRLTSTTARPVTAAPQHTAARSTAARTTPSPRHVRRPTKEIRRCRR